MHLILSTLVFLSVRFSYSFVLESKHADSSIFADNRVCKTKGCKKAAKEILANIDDTLDPCDDFYQFACGGFISKNTIPDNEGKISTNTDVIQALYLQLKGLMKRRIKKTDPDFVKKVKFVYDSCMNLKKINKLGSKPLKKILNFLGGWPVVDGQQWDSSKFDLVNTTLALHQLGLYAHYILGVGIAPDIKNNKIHLISIVPPIVHKLSNNLEDPATAAYFKLMIKSAKKLGAYEASAKKELMFALKFEQSIQEFFPPPEDEKDPRKLYNTYTLHELPGILPQIDWPRLLNGLLHDNISFNERINIQFPDYFEKLSTVLEDTDKRTIANYMMWRVVRETMTLLSKDWWKLMHDYGTAVSGISKVDPRYKKCLEALSVLHVAAGYYYIKYYFKEDSKEKANVLVEHIRKEFLRILKNDTDWMDKDTKLQAINKAKAMLTFVGYPQELLDEKQVSHFYENMEVKKHYFNTAMALRKWELDKAMSKLRKPNIRKDWREHSDVAEVNAYQRPSANSIEIPAGILQKMYFRKNSPNYMNYGAIGHTIGHEITHGFDNEGRLYDKYGNVKEWWTESSEETFLKKADCIIKQYGNYTTEIGLKTHCAILRPETLKMVVQSDPHSPEPLRVIGPMSNLAEFSADFNCPLGSNMNPRKKCRVW